jgi:DNA-binding transcriptional ArsR family regulator
MVVRAESVDRVFHALADGTRRDIVAVVLQGEQSVSDLARRYPMSFAAVQKHVAVLERAGLVTKQRRGREQRVRGDIDGLREVRCLLDQLEVLWRQRLGRIEDLLADHPGTDPAKGASP